MTITSEKHDIERFAQWSSTYEQSWLQRHFFNRVHQTMLGFIAESGPAQNILDVGCGTGHLLREIHQRWPEVQLTGVDAADGMIEVAQQFTPEATFHVGRAEQLPLPDSSVDIVLSTISFHHWSDQTAGLREVARVLRPGGRFLLVDISAPVFWTWLTRSPRVHNAVYLRNLFTQAGLEVVQQKTIISRFVLATVGRHSQT